MHSPLTTNSKVVATFTLLIQRGWQAAQTSQQHECTVLDTA